MPFYYQGSKTEIEKDDQLIIKNDGDKIVLAFERKGEPICVGFSIVISEVALKLKPKDMATIIKFVIFLNSAFIGREMEDISQECDHRNNVLRVVFGDRLD